MGKKRNILGVLERNLKKRHNWKMSAKLGG
jgi:hypothetical protein